MADFTALATRYVLADDEDEQRQLAREAAQGIKNAQRKSTAVLSWAQSINAWMPGGRASGDDDDNVIARAKALGFLAATLEALDDDVLRVEQVEHLIAFFGAMFAIDHKAGILAAATALRCLCAMSHFRPSMAAAVLQHMAKLGDDFRLQAAPTRLAIYGLVTRLLGDDAVLRALQQAQGPACSFLADGLLPLCRHERDPDNLLRWFATLRLVLERYDPLAPDVAEEIFKTVSDYFPISMRSAATPAGTTVDDLKTALRACFSASAPASVSVFDFLLQKLDQGDALTVSVKVDILRTIHACVTTFARPDQTVYPQANRVWSALKYEVRHGDVPETVDWTLRVIQALSTTLNGTAAAPLDPACARDFVERVLADCINDLANPTYAKAAGQLLTSTLRGGLRSYNLGIAPVLAAVKQNMQKAQMATYIRDLLAFLGDVLRTRQGLVEASSEASAEAADRTEFYSHDAAIVGLLDGVYLRLWKGDKQDPIVLAQIMNGLAELVGQRGSSGGLLCSPEQCREIFTALAPRVQYDVAAAALPDHFQELAHEAMLALKKATAAYPEEFAYLVERAVASVKNASQAVAPAALVGLRDSLSRLAVIGCSTIDDSLRHFSTLTHALDDALAVLLQEKASFQLANVILSGIYGVLLNIRDALSQEMPVFDVYLKEATTLVRQLYVRATTPTAAGLELSADFDLTSASSASALDDQDQYLHQLASIATFVVRDQTVDQQIETKLHEAPFSLFHEDSVNPSSSLFHSQQGGRVDVLSLGILRGLHPTVVVRLGRVDLLTDLDGLDGLPQRTRLVRNGMATIVANKYSASTAAHPDNAAAWRDTVAAVRARLEAPLTPPQFARLVAVAAGAFARLDRDARGLAALLAAAPAKYSRTTAEGEQMARTLGQLVSTGADCLAPANHAVVKSVYKQWVYSQTVQPLLPLAFPRRDDTTTVSHADAIAVLALVRHMPFSVYEDDVEAALVRILVAAATTLPGWADVGQALRVLQVVLEHRPEALQGHLNTLVDASMAVFGTGLVASPKTASTMRRGVPPPGCRKQALRLVAQLPPKFEEGLLLPYGPRLARALAAACGDRVREIREAAQLARESWNKVPL